MDILAEAGRNIDRQSPIPLYYQLKTILLEAIESGHYPYGGMFPAEMEIVEQTGLSRTTVRQSIAELVSEGWLSRHKGKGTFVSRPKIPQDFVQRLESFNDQMRRLNKEPKTEVLVLERRSADGKTREKLRLEEDDAVFLWRVRYADDEPIVTIKTYLPLEVEDALRKTDPEQVPLYRILQQKEKWKISYVVRTIEATLATEEDAKLLQMKKGEAILAFESIGYNLFDEPVEYSLARYCAKRSNFEVTVFATDTP